MNWIENQVRAVSMKRLFAAAVVLAIVIIALVANARYISNFFKGPYAISGEELGAAAGVESMPVGDCMPCMLSS